MNDLKFGFRQLLKNPGFTAVAVLTLALGIGANTAIFSVVDVALLKWLPVRNPEQLYLIAHAGERGVTEVNNFPFFEHLRDHNQSFAGLLAFNPNQWKVTLNGETEIVAGQVVTGNYFSALGVNALLGRLLTLEDDKVPQGHPVAVISYAYWQRRFGKDPEVLGKTITINLTPFTIIGVTPPEFFGLQVGRSAEISVPMTMHSLVGSGAKLSERKFWWNLPILGRLKPGVKLEQAQAELDLLQQQFLAEAGMEADPRKDFFARVELMPAQRGLAELRKQFSSPLQVLMGIVGIVLLIACANVANLLLARATVRQKEISIRLALGASRLRLIRQLLTESLLLALFGGGIGFLFAYWGAQFLLGFIPPQGAPLTLQISPDARILGFTAAVSLLTGILFGLAPAWRATRVQLNATLKDKKQSLSGGQGRLGFGRVLIVSQIALSLLLLIGAGLFVRSLQKLRHVETGFNNWDHILLFSSQRVDRTRRVSAYKELLGRLEESPGVRAASMSFVTPLTGDAWGQQVDIEGYTPGPKEVVRCSGMSVARRYFETMGTPLLNGRDFGPQDERLDASNATNAPGVAIINVSMARKYFGNASALGRRFSFFGSADRKFEIVGVVKDAKYSSLREPAPPTFYLFCFGEVRDWDMMFALRTTGKPVAVMDGLRRAVRETNPTLLLRGMRTMEDVVDASLRRERIIANLGGFSLTALALACLGLYGILSFTVAQRTREIGVRVALGAQRVDVFSLVVGKGLKLAVIGSAIGLLGALAVTRLVSRLLYGVSPIDPVTFASMSLLLVAVAMLASWIPARRAAKVDPMVALRYE